MFRVLRAPIPSWPITVSTSSATRKRLRAKKRRPSVKSLNRPGRSAALPGRSAPLPVLGAVGAVRAGFTGRRSAELMAMYDTRYESALNSSAHCRPTANSSGAASGGPMIQAVCAVAWAMPAARARSASSVTSSAMIENRAGVKNWLAALSTSTIT